jgi:hypothetical protein
MASRSAHSPLAGWIVTSSADQVGRDQERSKTLEKWLSLRSLLTLVLGVWNGYFLAALVYELLAQSSSEDSALRVILLLWVVGDVAILLCSWGLRAVLRSTRGSAERAASESSHAPRSL